MDGLIEGVLAVCARLAPEHLDWSPWSLESRRIGRSSRWTLWSIAAGTPETGAGIAPTGAPRGSQPRRICGPYIQQTQQRGHVAGEFRIGEMPVDRMKSGKELGEVLWPNGDRHGRTDRRIHRAPASDPVPKAERVLRVDAEGGHLVEGGGHVAKRLATAAFAASSRSSIASAARSPASSQLRASRESPSVSSVAKVWRQRRRVSSLDRDLSAPRPRRWGRCWR